MRLRAIFGILAVMLLAANPGCDQATEAGDVRSMSVPSASKTELAVVQQATQLLSAGSHWNHTDNATCPPNARTFSIDCVLEEAARKAGNAEAHCPPPNRRHVS